MFHGSFDANQKTTRKQLQPHPLSYGHLLSAGPLRATHIPNPFLETPDAADARSASGEGERDHGGHLVLWEGAEGDRDPTLLFNASRYASQQIRDKKYVCLWYWTRDGMLEAAAQRHTSASDRESPNAVPDTALSWQEITQAGRHYIRAMKMHGWSLDVQRMFAHFFETLADCHAQYIPYQDEAVVAYQEVVRHQFYDEISRGEAWLTNIGNINIKQLEQLKSNAALNARL